MGEDGMKSIGKRIADWGLADCDENEASFSVSLMRLVVSSILLGILTGAFVAVAVSEWART